MSVQENNSQLKILKKNNTALFYAHRNPEKGGNNIIQQLGYCLSSKDKLKQIF